MELDPVDIYAIVMIVLLALLWGVFIPMKRRADKRWAEHHARNIELLRRAWQKEEKSNE